jgi:hypothetical protein
MFEKMRCPHVPIRKIRDLGAILIRVPVVGVGVGVGLTFRLRLSTPTTSLLRLIVNTVLQYYSNLNKLRS